MKKSELDLLIEENDKKNELLPEEERVYLEKFPSEFDSSLFEKEILNNDDDDFIKQG